MRFRSAGQTISSAACDRLSTAPVTNAQCRIREFSRKLRKNRFNAAFFVDRMSLPYKMQDDFAELRQGGFTLRAASSLPPTPLSPQDNGVLF